MIVLLAQATYNLEAIEIEARVRVDSERARIELHHDRVLEHRIERRRGVGEGVVRHGRSRAGVARHIGDRAVHSDQRAGARDVAQRPVDGDRRPWTIRQSAEA